ncbi:MAG: o-succinylbenzoate--CoA ligase [Anaerolineae bacterium]|nr:o-succinylbenzoate--CoA ligase [Anaerolineae bacterium]
MLDWLAHRAKISPAKVALLFGEQSWTYAELNQYVAEYAAKLSAYGVAAGQHVAVLLSNRVEFVVIIHALARLNATIVPLNIRLTAEELRWQIEQSDSRLLICGCETEATAADLTSHIAQTISVDPSSPHNIASLNDISVENLADWQARTLPLDGIQGIIYTSGTTGRPKGAMLSYHNHFLSAAASAYRLGTVANDRWLLCMPLYHVGGMAIVLRCCLYGTTVVLQNGFNEANVRHALDHQAVTLISVVPTMLHRLLDTSAESLARSRLRCVLVGGAAATAELVDRCIALNLPVATTYGLTEAASQVATASPENVKRKPGHVGKPLMFSSLRIVDDQGQTVEAGTIGEVVVSGPTVMHGYYRQPEATAKVLNNGELYTGDMGYLDSDGDLWVVQRRADLIVSGGENVYPVEVEAVLRQHPAVDEACVFGIEDTEWGQRVAAMVVGKPGKKVSAQELMDFCRDYLAGYKLPRTILFIDALPRTASGKVRRDQVRRQAV